MSDQNIRDETGALIGGLDCLEYARGFEDYINGLEPPSMTTRDYDLGRQAAAERASNNADVMSWIKRDSERRMARMKEMLTPEAFREFEAKIKDIWAERP
jgi:hypothetical protein